jgi:hypothetical protein
MSAPDCHCIPSVGFKKFRDEDYKMNQNKKKCLYAVGLFILIPTVLIIMALNSKEESISEPPPKLVLPSDEVSIDAEENSGVIVQDKQNAVIEDAETEELEDPLFNELVDKEITALAYKMKWDVRLPEHLESMKESDREGNQKWELPGNVLGETSTDKLFLHLIQSPMVPGFLMLYSEEEIGLQRILNSSSTMQEFYGREDFAEGVLQMYREYDFSPKAVSDEVILSKYSDSKILENPEFQQLLAPENITSTKIVNLCMPIMYADRVMLCRQMFSKTKGYEKEFLKAMVDRYEKIAELKKKYDNEQDPFGTALTCVSTFCIRLAGNTDEKLCTKLKEIEFEDATWEERFIGEVKGYLALENQ